MKTEENKTALHVAAYRNTPIDLVISLVWSRLQGGEQKVSQRDVADLAGCGLSAGRSDVGSRGERYESPEVAF